MSNKGDRFSQATLNELAAMKIEENSRESGASGPGPGVPLNFSVAVFELMMRKESDPASAMRLLEILAKDLKAGIVPNPSLAEYVARAIEKAAAQPLNSHPRALTDALHLTSKNRRPASSWLEIGHAMNQLIVGGMSQNKAKADVAAYFEIDESTVLAYYKHFVEAEKIDPRGGVNKPDTP